MYMDSISPSAPVNTNYSQYAPVSDDLREESSNLTSLYGREILERDKESHVSVIPEKYRIDVSHQRRIIKERKMIGTRKCYTCFPKRLAQEHTISWNVEKNMKFHFDMCNRPLLIATPIKHIKTISEFSPEELGKFFQGISEFCAFWNIKDFQIQINHGEWQHHEHLHAKIRANEDLIYNMRQNHFKLIKMQKERKKTESAENTAPFNS